MKYLFIICTLSIVTFIACSDSPATEDSPYPVQMGTWQVNSETQSDWTGIKGKAASDTVTITSAGQQGFSIYKTSETIAGQFVLTFIDSSITEPTHPDFGMDYHLIVPRGPDYEIQPLSSRSSNGSLNNERYKLNIIFDYKCYEDFLAESDTVTVELLTRQGNSLKFYKFPTSGFVDVIDHIVCGDPI